MVGQPVGGDLRGEPLQQRAGLGHAAVGIRLDVARYPFLREARTAPRYRFYVYQDRFPALWPVHDGGVSVPGELIELPLEAVRDEFLPVEPEELELGVIELADGSASLAVVLRPEVQARGTGLVDISDYGGWRTYLEQR